MGESITGVRFTDQAALELSKLQGSEEYKAFLPYIAVSVHYRSVQVAWIDLKLFSIQWGMSPGSHLGLLSMYSVMESSLCNSFKDQACVEEIYRYPIFQ